VLELTNPWKWTGLFLDFWIGAPNSGEDFWRNVDVGASRYPMFHLFMGLWLAAIVAVTLLAAAGALSIGRKELILPCIVFIASLIPFVSNGLARMFIAVFPFAVLAAAKGFDGLRMRHKHAALLAALLLFMSGSYAYSYTYKDLRDPYLPFFEKMRAEIPADARVVMPFADADCIYYSGRMCIRLGSTGGIPEPNEGNLDRILSENGIAFVCCSSLNQAAFSKADRLICDRFAELRPDIDYAKGGVWGKCWATDW